MTQETTTDGLCQEKPRLSDVLEVQRLHRGRANIVKAPCDSGKTTAVKKRMIPEIARDPSKVLYLIDTHAGRDALINREKGQLAKPEWIHRNDPEWCGERCDHTSFTVMTYHHFGYAYEATPSMLQDIDLIICDEMHNLIRYMGIENSNNENDNVKLGLEEEERCCRTALGVIERLSSSEGAPVIVILSATPERLIDRFVYMDVPYGLLDYTGVVREDKTGQKIHYADFASIVPEITGKAIIYVSRIDLMKKYAEFMDDGTRKVVCLWSVNSKQAMSKEQLKVREALLKNERIPDDVDILFLNAAYETSINIRNEEFKTAVVHCSNKAVQTQVRGRLRHDIETLYLYDKQHENISEYFPERYLNVWMPPWMIGRMIDELDIKNADSRTLRWPSIRKLLENDGFCVMQQRIKQHRCWRVTREAA